MAKLLITKLKNIFKIKNLKINFTNKKVYLFINKVNKVEYYYNQIKSCIFD